jgi:hypothetical protein
MHGSGGLGFFVKNSLLSEFNVKIINNSVVGILWLEFKHKVKDVYIYIYLCM